MSEFHVEVVRVGPLEKHPNADTLMLTKVRDYPVIVKQGDFLEGDLAVYVPVDSVVPLSDPRWAFLQGHGRIKAKKLRGVFSMGLLTAALPGAVEGQDVAALMGITKYEPPEPLQIGGDGEKCGFDFPKYTDIEGLRRYPDVIKDDEEVIITEKIHGTNARFVFKDGRLWVGSHNTILKDDPDNAYWKAARQNKLAERLEKHPDIVLYGEVYGWVQDLRYGHTPGKVSLLFFDAFDLKTFTYFGLDRFLKFLEDIGLPFAHVPALYRGPWVKNCYGYAEGDSHLCPGQVREGVVIRPVVERFNESVGRVILKLHGQGYLLRKG